MTIESVRKRDDLEIINFVILCPNSCTCVFCYDHITYHQKLILLSTTLLMAKHQAKATTQDIAAAKSPARRLSAYE